MLGFDLGAYHRRMRLAIVLRLASGKAATVSEHGRVHWQRTHRDVLDWLASFPTNDSDIGPVGYSLPFYALYGPSSIIKAIDAVIGTMVVSEGEWESSLHHTVPYTVVR